MQKKLGAIFSVIIILSTFFLGSFSTLHKFLEDKEVYQYSYSSNCEISKNLLALFKTGESGLLKDGLDFKEVILALDGKIIFVEEIGETTNFYCYSENISWYTMLNNKKINLHFAKGKDCVKVGSPLIFGSF